MEKRYVVDADGEWYTNEGDFPFTDPSNGVRFEPRTAVQIKPTAWMKSQPVIVKIDLPGKAPEPPAPVPPPVEPDPNKAPAKKP